jgi:hypothetical protein
MPVLAYKYSNATGFADSAFAEALFAGAEQVREPCWQLVIRQHTASDGDDEPKRNAGGKLARNQAAPEFGPGIAKIGQIFEEYLEIQNGYEQPQANRRVHGRISVDENGPTDPSKFRVICKHICLLLLQQIGCRNSDRINRMN